MENVKIYSFVGAEHEEIPYYIAQALSEKKKNVLVIDNSVKHNLFESLNRLDEEADSVEAGKIIFLRNKRFTENTLEKFDCVVVFHGMNPDLEMMDASDRNVLVLSYLTSELREIMNTMDLDDVVEYENLSYLFKDKPSSKVSETYIKKMLDLPQVEDETVISFDENDLAMKSNFEYNGIQPVKGLSSETRAYINSFVNEVTTGKKKEDNKKKEEDE